ncbi:hypothetical protein NDU88_001631 [Pleurodeles waltl]|uniref:Uncharacterized protein n=1 Tax=Pleurodeles waltl TaxID=8319 RepID=A0AAV7T0I7_PLEWA|nr:hypothetical protein NDU88_001631 [Pleurodeles waltl]
MSRDDLTSDLGRAQRASMGPASSAEVLVQMAASVLMDHKYDPLFTLEASSPAPGLSAVTLDASQLASSHSSGSDQDDPKSLGKCKRKSQNIEEDNQTQ